MRRLSLIATVLLLTACSATPPAVTPSASAPAPSSTAAADTVVDSLLARPLRLPTVPAGGACPVSGVTVRSPVAQEADARGLGTGPLYPITFYIGEDATLRLGQRTPGPDGLYALKAVWATDASYQGPVVVRVGRLDGAGRGVVSLLYDESASRGDAVVFTLSGYPADFPSFTSVSGPGCYAYQIDGLNFSEIIVFRVVA